MRRGERETPDSIRGRVFAADYGFVTLTMSVSSILTGIAADRFGPVRATIGTASAALLFAIIWGPVNLASLALTRASPLRPRAVCAACAQG